MFKSYINKQGVFEETVDFSTVYDRYWQAMFVYAMAIVKDKDNAEDVVQEVFTHLLAAPDGIQLRSSLENYLFTCVRNEALLKIRKTAREKRYVAELAQEMAEGIDTTTGQLAAKELDEILLAHVEKLSQRAKAVFHKSRIEGKSHKEIASELNISEDTSRTTLYRTIRKLKIQLKPFLTLLLFGLFG